MSIMSPEALVTLLAAYPYPGCIITRPGGAVRLDFDGLTLVYKADGWHFGDLHLESKLNHFAAEATTAEIRRILKVVMTLKVGRALGEAETLRSEDPVEYLTNLAAEKMLAILDVAALANVRQAKIASNVADAAARDMRIAELERDLACKDDAVKTAHAALAQVSDLLGSPPPVVPDDVVEAVKMHLAQRPQPATVESDLDAAGAPKVYHLEDGGEREIPTAERIRLLGERVRGEHAERIREGDRAAVYRERLAAADLALDDRNAPRLADGAPLSVAARIRALPC